MKSTPCHRSLFVRRWRIALATVALSLVGLAPRVLAENVVFTIDKPQSNFSVVVNDNALGTSFAQPGGSLSSPVSGHFLIDFNPNSFDPDTSSIQFVGGDGYINLDNTSPPGGYLPFSTPGEIGGQSSGNDFRYAVRGLVWDWQSGSLGLTSGQFDTGGIGYHVLGGVLDYVHPALGPSPVVLDYTGNEGLMDAGGPTNFVEESPGNWRVEFTAQLVSPYSAGPTVYGNSTYTAQLVAHAQFGTANTNTVSGGGVPQSTTVIGGATQIGGLDVAFDDVITGGSVTAQAISSLSGLSLPAQEALANATNFQVAGGDSPQLWNVSFNGEFSGTATLTFNYNPAVVANPGSLVVLHYNEGLGDWENLGGIVDEFNHTITVETTSFSPFIGVELVPEPSSIVLAAIGLIGAALLARRRSIGASGPIVR